MSPALGACPSPSGILPEEMPTSGTWAIREDVPEETASRRNPRELWELWCVHRRPPGPPAGDCWPLRARPAQQDAGVGGGLWAARPLAFCFLHFLCFRVSVTDLGNQVPREQGLCLPPGTPAGNTRGHPVVLARQSVRKRVLSPFYSGAPSGVYFTKILEFLGSPRSKGAAST